MGINVVLKGEGDMKKSTYDPDEDGVIAIANTEADMKKSVYDNDNDNVVDSAEVAIVSKYLLRKIPSDNLRNSHDAEVSTTNTTYTKVKTITFTYGISGTIRVKFDMYSNNIAGYGKVYKNGSPIGSEHTLSSNSTWESFSEDIDIGDISAGGTLELWIKNTSGVEVKARNFRLYYDNEITAPATNS